MAPFRSLFFYRKLLPIFGQEDTTAFKALDNSAFKLPNENKYHVD